MSAPSLQSTSAARNTEVSAKNSPADVRDSPWVTATVRARFVPAETTAPTSESAPPRAMPAT